MLANPCGAEIHPGIFGTQEGLMATVKSEVSLGALASSTCGYVVWCPALAGGSGPTHGASMFTWLSTDPNLAPTNSIANPFGLGPTGTTTIGTSDPAHTFMHTGIAGSCRTVSACMQMAYIGRSDENQGQVTILEDIPQSVIFGDPNILGQPPIATVNTLINYCGNGPQRFTNQTQEVRYRPDPDNAGTFVQNSAESSDCGIELGVNAVSVSEWGGVAHDHEPKYIGYAFRGFAADKLGYEVTLSLVKNIEWQMAPIYGLAATPSVQIHPTSMVSRTVQLLDKADPNWASTAKSAAGSLVSQYGPGLLKQFKGAMSSEAGSFLGAFL